MLETSQLSNLDSAQQDLNNKKLLLNNLIDVQALLRILVDKDIITKEEMDQYRDEVRRSPKYSALQTFIDQTQQEIDTYKKDPQALLREMLKRKTMGQ